MLDLNSILAHQTGIVFRLVGNHETAVDQELSMDTVEGIIVLPERGEIKVVNEIGARIWSLIDGQKSIQEIAIQINNEYQVNVIEAQKDTLDFVRTLEERGLVFHR
jgi:hypothetical protein